MTAYIGHLSTTSGDGPEVVIKLEGTEVIVLTPDERRHVWPAGLVKVTAVTSPRFWIAFDDEVAVFTAHHPSQFLFGFVPELANARLESTEADQADGGPPSGSPATPRPGYDPDHATAEKARPIGVEAGQSHTGAGIHQAAAPAAGPAPRSSMRKPKGPHWSTADGAAGIGSSLLRAAASTRADRQTARPDPDPEPASEAESPAPRQPLTAYRPRRRRWSRRATECTHEWVPRTIGGYEGQICVECFEVSLIRDPVSAQPSAETPEPDHVVVDLTDAASREEAAASGSLLERLAGQYRAAQRTVGVNPPE